ncbi:hypothetical protein E7703_14285 [Citrobacter portucalensis]|uniref:hypothetical protein n=1 Tax=Citrobacter portucalensis TaxID=1639133 RepID=UPI0010A4FC3C|nr:hypothetical protein [Citrobacter portucalensis]QCD02256.1 hypothetical protein E7703_14285 [Citrobacter portucalensis]
MVVKVLSRFKTGAPKEPLKDGEERMIEGGPLYPELASVLDECQVKPVTNKTNDFLAIHRVDLGDVRKYVELALAAGRYINSQWCNGNAPKGIFACDAYVVSAQLYIPSKREISTVLIYIKVCILDTGNTVAIISLHESTNTKDLS